MSNDIFVRTNPVTNNPVEKSKILVVAQFMSAGSVALLVSQEDLEKLGVEHSGEFENRNSVSLQDGTVKKFKTTQRVPVVA